MKNILLICFIIFISYCSAYSQIPDTVWTKTFGGPLFEWGNQVQQTIDGGYILVGWTRSFGAGYSDLWLIKTDPNGDAIWTKTYGGDYYDYGYSVQQTNDGGYIVAGMTASGSNGGVWLIKTDSLGEAIWTKTLGSGYANSIDQTSDGGYIIVGDKGIDPNPPYPRDILLIKTDSSGNTIWSKTFRGDYPINLGVSVKQITEDEYVFLGYSYNIGIDKCLLIKTDDLGNAIWTKTFDLGVVQDEAFSFQQTTDGGYIIAGITTSFSGNGDVWILKTDASGDLLWTKVFEGNDYVEGANSIQQTLDGGYIIAGFSKLAGADYFDMLIIKTDDDGGKLWTKNLGGNLEERANSIQLTKDGGYIITGYTESFGAGDSDIWLLKFNYPTPINVQINFFPPVDTAWIFGGCTGLDLISHNLISTPTRDSITIEPGPSSYFFYYDSLGNQILVDKYYFIVEDSLNQYDYELWFHPKSWAPFDSVQITFDSLFYFQQNLFDIQLLVKLNGNPIDSLSQLFRADWGLGVEENGEPPAAFSLSQNYPNPFNPSTKIKYEIPFVTLRQSAIGGQSDILVTLKVYDVLGNEIATLVNEEKQAGNYEVEFDATNLTSGIYFYQLKAGNYIETKKMVLMK